MLFPLSESKHFVQKNLSITDFRYGKKKRTEVNIEQTASFLFSTYIVTIGGLWKLDPAVKAQLKVRYCRSELIHLLTFLDTDLHRAQSILY
jgi:hypothetical protein